MDITWGYPSFLKVRLAAYEGGVKALESTADGIVSKCIADAGIIAIPCTSCRYCVDECPKKIPIPDIFTIYNERERSRDVYYPKVNYEKLVAEENRGRASECIKCRKCEQHCPQHIEVTKWLEHIAGEFE